jgi:hypothetical protein
MESKTTNEWVAINQVSDPELRTQLRMEFFRRNGGTGLASPVQKTPNQEAQMDNQSLFRRLMERQAQTDFEDLMKTAGTWTRKEGQNPEGGLNQKGRDSYNRETGGNLKRPVSKEEAKKSDKSAARRRSFCARMSGMKKRLTSSETARDPDSRINKALRKWDC